MAEGGCGGVGESVAGNDNGPEAAGLTEGEGTLDVTRTPLLYQRKGGGASSFVSSGEPLGFPLDLTPVHNTLLRWCTTVCCVVGDDRHRPFPLGVRDKFFLST